jgi:putative transposase
MRYNVTTRSEDKDAKLKESIQAIKEKAPAAGYRQVTAQLHARNLCVNHKKVLRIMRELSLLSTAFRRPTRKYVSYKGTLGTIAPNRLNCRFNTDRPFQKLTSDVTEMRWDNKTIEERAYFTCIYDLYSREVLSYGLSLSPSVEFTVAILKQGIAKIPSDLNYRTTVHTDQGFQYQNYRWVKELRSHRIFQSMSRKVTCLDNAAMESFFHIMKTELYYMQDYGSLQEVTEAVENWLIYYNNDRCKQKLGGASPVNYRTRTTQKAA